MIINQRFANVAPPLAPREYEMLKADILQNGCIAPLVVWNGMLVDGHNRYKICRENSIPFKTVEMQFTCERDAILWIIKNQLGRRNLTPFQRCEMVIPYGKELMVEAEKRRRERISIYRKTGKSGATGISTGDILANMAGVSRGTLWKAQVIIEVGDEETKRRVRNGEISINYAYNSLFYKPIQPRPATWLDEMAGSISIDDDYDPVKPTRLEEIEIAIDYIISRVRTGDASAKSIIEDLTKVSTMIKEGR